MKKDVTFRYDAEHKTWAECLVPEWNQDETDGLPIIPVLDYCDERTGDCGKRVWCEIHHAYEKIGHCTEDGMITEKGCRLKGLLIPLGGLYPMSTGWIFDANDESGVMRWRMKYRRKGTCTFSKIRRTSVSTGKRKRTTPSCWLPLSAPSATTM